MSPVRLCAIALIYFTAAVAWFVLGTTVVARSGEFDSRLSSEVALLWGGPHIQRAPELWYERPKTVNEAVERTDASGRKVTENVTRVVSERVPVVLRSSDIDVTLTLDHRKKGLLWYDTYGVQLRATYRAANPATTPQMIRAHLSFPSGQVQFDNFAFRMNGQAGRQTSDDTKGAISEVEVPPGADIVIDLAYDSRGVDTWAYAFSGSGVAEVQNFALDLRADFDGFDFPAGTMSPSSSRPVDGGWELGWRFNSLLTGRSIGVDLPNRLNPGPLTARITYFAPVSLLFFLTVMVMLGVLRGENLHPVHYAFLSAGFFAFHLLLAYLVDHLSVHWSFAAATATSVFLVTSYLRGVAGIRFAVARAGIAQLVFLVLFSYAFFFEGYTGLTVTVGAIVTLFVLMQATVRVDWGTVFVREGVR
jgi:Inner membrane protein CreD